MNSKSERSDSDDYRNGFKTKQVNSSYGSMEIEVSRDRKSTYEPKVVKKRQKDISDIDQKIISIAQPMLRIAKICRKRFIHSHLGILLFISSHNRSI